jgi:DNA-binding MarR family transcriptional regulator
VELTDEGRAQYRRLLTITRTGHAQLLRGFTEEETASLLDMLARIRRNITE